ncbi:MAG: glycoside hydrolase family 13 protein [Acholeplasmataceae bacterium]
MNERALWHQAKSAYSYAYDDRTLHILLRTASGDADRVSLVYGDPFAWKIDRSGKPTWDHEIAIMQKRYETSLFDVYFLAIEPANLRTKYTFLLEKDGHTYAFGSRRLRPIEENDRLYDAFDLSEFFNFPYIHGEDLHRTPAWVKDTIWYQIFLDRFYRVGSDNRRPWGELPVHNHRLFGGNLQGVIAKLPYLEDLGINGIYFTPIFESPSAHKYDTTDYFRIDPQFGTNDDFKELVNEAHARGIRVMLDGVFNHAGYDHPYFQDVIKNGEKSAYSDCFYIEKYPVINFPLDRNGRPIRYHGSELNFRTFAFTPYMPKWNTGHPLVRKHLLEAISYWIREYDIDGWRLDVSNEISHEFLREIKQVSRKEKADTFILGENWDASLPWLMGDQLDSVMNYDLSYPLWKYLEQEIDLKTFRHMVTTHVMSTPKNVIENMFNLVGSHDTIRIKRRLGDDPRRVKLAYLFMFLSAGAPNIYYGDEVGLTGEHDPDNRRTMLWDEHEQDVDFLRFVRRLVELRKKRASFRHPDFHFLDLDILAFFKRATDDAILVLMNNGEKKTFDIPSSLNGTYRDVFSAEKLRIHGRMTLEAYQFLVLEKEETG